jgi:oligoribonuclease NrnB/cAMP/cGMP phosphodiesterase (DHH superfamily)
MHDIVVLTHNDLDALGCMLNIEYALPNDKIYFHTNYKNLDDVCHDIETYLKKYNPKLLIIADVSFAEHKSQLRNLVQTETKILYVDHHVYPDDFFDEFDFVYKHDINKSATLLMYEFFKNDNETLYKLTDLINMYDIWLIENPKFPLSLNLNDYFWEYIRETSIQNLMENIINCNYNMPKNYNDRIEFFQSDAKKQIEKYYQRKLIHCDGFTTIAFVDSYFSEILYKEFTRGINVVIIANSYGIIRIRFNNILEHKIKEKIKIDVIGTLNKGHINAFSLKVKDISFKSIMNEIKRITDIIKKHKG